MSSIRNIFILFILLAFVASCSIFGDKQNDTVDDVLKQGQIDPNLVPKAVSYVPIFPFFKGFQHPVDIYVGYDEMIYVIDDKGLNILDQKGTLAQIIAIPGATEVTQDRRLHTYVIGKVFDSGVNATVTCVYHLKGTGQGNYEFVDTLIHPFCDASRQSTQYRGADDEAVEFTGIACLFDNTLYVGRKGPRNETGTFIRPDNAILVFSQDGENIGYAAGLNPNESSLKTAVGISGLATYAAPPQRLQGISTSKNIFLTSNNQTANLEYKALSINVIDDPDLGTQYTENASFLNFDISKASTFLYEPFRFKKPEDCFIAPDATNYIFVVDSETDSVYVFTNQGFEGVNPPANSGIKKQVNVSFGGRAADGQPTDGPFNFNNPMGICYNRRMIYVADRDNNRICRYKLNTDLE
ncbi:MAG: hypothetical protein V4620_09345 [Bacteroidota bacterium]